MASTEEKDKKKKDKKDKKHKKDKEQTDERSPEPARKKGRSESRSRSELQGDAEVDEDMLAATAKLGLDEKYPKLKVKDDTATARVKGEEGDETGAGTPQCDVTDGSLREWMKSMETRMCKVEISTISLREQLTEMQLAQLSTIVILKPRDLSVATLRSGLDRLISKCDGQSTIASVVGHTGKWSRPFRIFLRSPQHFVTVKNIIDTECPGVIAILENATTTKVQEKICHSLKKEMLTYTTKEQLDIGWPMQGHEYGADSFSIGKREEGIACTVEFKHRELEVLVRYNEAILKELNMTAREFVACVEKVPKMYRVSVQKIVPSETLPYLGRNSVWKARGKGNGKGIGKGPSKGSGKSKGSNM